MSAIAAERHAVRTTAPVLRFTDSALDAISTRLASVPPERGGALLAVGDLLYLLVEDSHGQYTGASWYISGELSQTIARLEAAAHGTFAGTVHTHPDGVPDPSAPDVSTTGKTLARNSHLDALVIAVVTVGPPRADDLPVGGQHRMSLHVLRQADDGAPQLIPARGEVVPLAADLSFGGVALPSATDVRTWLSPQLHRRKPQETPLPTVVRVNRRPRLVVPLPAERPAALFIDPDYPQVGPLAVISTDSSDGDEPSLLSLPSPWDPTAPAAPQLAALARAAAGRHLDGATDRVWPLVGTLAERRVLLAGAGSVGSRIAEDMVRCGVGAFTVIDPDVVDPPNLARTVYAAADVGTAKPDALARRLRAVDPSVRVAGHAEALGALDLRALLDEVDLVVGATDDMGEQALLAHHAYAAGIPLVACALYKAAAAGEVVISVPAANTACWSCAVGERSSITGYRPDRDYGLHGRLVGEAALGPAIHMVTEVAAMASIGLLAGPDSPAGAHLKPLVSQNRTLGLISTVPNWEFFPKLFDGMSHQHAPQSVWVRVQPNPDCPVCGTNRTPPLTTEEGTAFADFLTKLRHQKSEAHDTNSPPSDDQDDGSIVTDVHTIDSDISSPGDGATSD
ncbi:HesA/MoeB/ThiF family protein [Streptomyces sp. NPDC018833]|uniref:HesA/MoeB/ThiF family protein n=1 Tax=Streptomyces sp. NPDC018833 TaxID=3365053 RepID=UPI0037B9FBF0